MNLKNDFKKSFPVIILGIDGEFWLKFLIFLLIFIIIYQVAKTLPLFKKDPNVRGGRAGAVVIALVFALIAVIFMPESLTIVLLPLLVYFFIGILAIVVLLGLWKFFSWLSKKPATIQGQPVQQSTKKWYKPWTWFQKSNTPQTATKPEPAEKVTQPSTQQAQQAQAAEKQEKPKKQPKPVFNKDFIAQCLEDINKNLGYAFTYLGKIKTILEKPNLTPSDFEGLKRNHQNIAGYTNQVRTKINNNDLNNAVKEISIEDIRNKSIGYINTVKALISKVSLNLPGNNKEEWHHFHEEASTDLVKVRDNTNEFGILVGRR